MARLPGDRKIKYKEGYCREGGASYIKLFAPKNTAVETTN